MEHVAQTEGTNQEQQAVAVELTIRIMQDGSIEVSAPENGRKLEAFEVENITRSVSEQMRDTRIAQQAVSMLKSALG